MERISCACDECRSYCQHKPGWIQYGEEQKMADKLNISVKEFFDRYLMIDYVQKLDSFYFVLSPAVKNGSPGSIFPLDSRGECIFYSSDHNCEIHDVSPMECQLAHHDIPIPEAMQNHFTIGQSWNNPEAQKLISDLYGKELIVQPPNVFEVLNFMLERAMGK